VREKVAEIHWTFVSNDHPANIALVARVGIAHIPERHLVFRLGDSLPPNPLNGCGLGVIGMEWEMKDDGLTVCCFRFFGAIPKAGVLLGGSDGAVEQRTKCVGFVSTGEKSLKKHTGAVLSVVVIAAESVDPKDAPVDHARKEAGSVGAVWGNVEMQIEGLLIQGGDDPAMGDGEVKIHKVDGRGLVTDVPMEATASVHGGGELLPSSVIDDGVGVAEPNANDVINEPAIEKKGILKPGEKVIFKGSKVQGGVRWRRRRSHGSAIELPKGGVPKRKDIVAHDKGKSFKDSVDRVRHVLGALVAAEEMPDHDGGAASRDVGIHRDSVGRKEAGIWR